MCAGHNLSDRGRLGAILEGGDSEDLMDQASDQAIVYAGHESPLTTRPIPLTTIPAPSDRPITQSPISLGAGRLGPSAN